MSVFKRGRVWWYNFVFQGVRYQESTRATSREVALQIEATRKTELGSVRARQKEPRVALRFADFVRTEFDPWCAIEHKDRRSTYARYMRSVKALNEFFGNQTLEAINAGMVEKYKIHRSQQKRKNARDGRLVTAAAVNRDLAVLRILFNYAVRLGIVAKNPVALVRFFRERQSHLRVLTADEEVRYLVSASPMLKDVAIVMLETGMRPGEICLLRREDVDVVLRSVHVRTGKTANATRFIPLTARALAVLHARVEESPSEWLFPCPFDPRKPVGSVRKAHDAAIARSGIQPKFRLYDLRHTALTRMAMAGIDLATLKELAGHSQIQMTMRYVHPTPEHKRRAIDKFEGFVTEVLTVNHSHAFQERKGLMRFQSGELGEPKIFGT